jgi:hypothetical protein
VGHNRGTGSDSHSTAQSEYWTAQSRTAAHRWKKALESAESLQIDICYCCSSVAAVMPQCCRSVTAVLLQCCSCVAVVLQWCCCSVAAVLQQYCSRCSSVAAVLQQCSCSRAGQAQCTAQRVNSCTSPKLQAVHSPGQPFAVHLRCLFQQRHWVQPCAREASRSSAGWERLCCLGAGDIGWSARVCAAERG